MRMVGRIALLDFEKCRPESCEGGICAASLACPQKAIHMVNSWTTYYL